MPKAPKINGPYGYPKTFVPVPASTYTTSGGVIDGSWNAFHSVRHNPIAVSGPPTARTRCDSDYTDHDTRQLLLVSDDVLAHPQLWNHCTIYDQNRCLDPNQFFRTANILRTGVFDGIFQFPGHWVIPTPTEMRKMNRHIPEGERCPIKGCAKMFTVEGANRRSVFKRHLVEKHSIKVLDEDGKERVDRKMLREAAKHETASPPFIMAAVIPTVPHVSDDMPAAVFNSGFRQFGDSTDMQDSTSVQRSRIVADLATPKPRTVPRGSHYIPIESSASMKLRSVFHRTDLDLSYLHKTVNPATFERWEPASLQIFLLEIDGRMEVTRIERKSRSALIPGARLAII